MLWMFNLNVMTQNTMALFDFMQASLRIIYELRNLVK